MTEINSEKKPPELLLKILGKFDEGMLPLVKLHLSYLVKYNQACLGTNEFPCKEEYENYVFARTFFDEFELSEDSETARTNSENSDSDKELESFLTKFPPLKSFHMSPAEKKAKLKIFWETVKEGDIFNAQVKSVSTTTYNLLILNRNMNHERLIDLSIQACMSKEDINQNLEPGMFIRVATLGSLKTEESLLSLLVTVNPSLYQRENPPVELGLITDTDIPFLPINPNDYTSFSHFFKTDSSCKEIKICLKLLPSLSINPYKAYLCNSELNGKQFLHAEETDDDEEHKREMAIAELKHANFFQSFHDYSRAMEHATKAIKLLPKYVEAYVFRGKLYLNMAAKKPCKLIQLASLDFEEAVKRSYGTNIEAVSEYCDLRLLSAKKFVEDQQYEKAKKNLKNIVKLTNNEVAHELLKKVEERIAAEGTGV